SERSTPSHNNATLKNLFAKKMIKSKFSHNYYVLGYITNSNHRINNLKVYSTPVVYKINGNTLTPIWVARLSLSKVTSNNVNTVIEYNDIIETNDSNIVLVGKYAGNTSQKEYVTATKLK